MNFIQMEITIIEINIQTDVNMSTSTIQILLKLHGLAQFGLY